MEDYSITNLASDIWDCNLCSLMHILVVTQYFWPENFRINDLVEGFVQRGHHVTVLTGMPNYPNGKIFSGYGLFGPVKERYFGADIVRVPLFPRRNGSGAWLALNFISFAISATLLAPFRCKGRYDVIFVHEPSPITVALPAILMGKIKSAPVLFWVLDLWPESLQAAGGVRSPLVLSLVKSMVGWIYKRCHRILVQSKAFIPRVCSFGIDHRKVDYFPSWAESLYQPLYSTRTLEPFGIVDGFCIMFAGNVGVSQDFEAILCAAQRLKDRHDIHWVIVGDGRMAAWVNDEIDRGGMRETMHMLGAHEVDKMPVFFAAADAMLVSLKDEEIFSLTIPGKLQSYFACGRPVIAMLNGEGSRIVNESGAGMTCASGDDEGLARIVCKMANMPEDERVLMGKRARQYFEHHFDRTMLFERLEQWMEIDIARFSG